MATQPWYDFPTTQPYGVNGETGYDIGTPFHTPITTLYTGVITNIQKNLPWGDQVAIRTNVPGKGALTEYFIHLDELSSSLKVGAQVLAGQVIGLSGGQTSGGLAPNNPANSTGPHTEFGFFTGSIWNSPTVNPLFALSEARAGQLPAATSTGIGSPAITPQLSGGGTVPATTPSASTTPGSSSPPFDPCSLPGAAFYIPGCQGQITQGVGQTNTNTINTGISDAIVAAAQGIGQQLLTATGATSVQDLEQRAGLIGGGIILVFIGILVLFFSNAGKVEEVAAPALSGGEDESGGGEEAAPIGLKRGRSSGGEKKESAREKATKRAAGAAKLAAEAA